MTCLGSQMLLASTGMWLMNGLSSSYIRKPVPQWSNSDVIEWISELGDSVQNECSEIFKKEVYTTLLLA